MSEFKSVRFMATIDVLIPAEASLQEYIEKKLHSSLNDYFESPIIQNLSVINFSEDTINCLIAYYYPNDREKLEEILGGYSIIMDNTTDNVWRTAFSVHGMNEEEIQSLKMKVKRAISSASVYQRKLPIIT